jgi:hypothetical protein
MDARAGVEERLSFDDPRVNLLALPCAFALAWLVQLSALGRMLLVPVQIQFHELGHAIMAWLSSRSALPLPFGFTFWREERSYITGACMVFLLAMWLWSAWREQRRFALFSGVALLVLCLRLSITVSAERSMMFVIAGGLAGELVLSCAALVTFYFPLPDRLRWDFFRFLLLVPAAATWLSAARLWLGVSAGTRALPMGSILGTPGDGSGDLDRLIAVYGYSAQAIARGYLLFTFVTGSIWLGTYAWFAWRARQGFRQM